MKTKAKKLKVLVASVILQLCIGTLYTWSLFNAYLSAKISVPTTSIVLAFSMAVFIFAFTTLFSGKLLDKFGPRLIAFIGGILYGLGILLCASATTPLQLYIFYGILSAVGIGFVYVCPLTTCVKWFPKEKGLITGIVVGSFGLGSLVFSPLIQYLLNNTSLTTAFLTLGSIYLILITLASFLLELPKTSSTSEPNNDFSKNNYLTKEMMKSKSFPFLWFIFLCGTMSGLLIIGLAKDIGIHLVSLSPSIAALSVSIISIFNTLGRLGFGALSDKISRFKIITILFSITITSLLLLSFIQLNIFTYFILLSSIAASFGGMPAIFPAITGDFYGIPHLGSNYGVMYQAYGASALISPILTFFIRDLKICFLICAVISTLGLFITLFFMYKSNLKVKK